jgi:hypothetical protein
MPANTDTISLPYGIVGLAAVLFFLPLKHMVATRPKKLKKGYGLMLRSLSDI